MAALNFVYNITILFGQAQRRQLLWLCAGRAQLCNRQLSTERQMVTTQQSFIQKLLMVISIALHTEVWENSFLAKHAFGVFPEA